MTAAAPELTLAGVGPEAAGLLAQIHAAAFDQPWSAKDLAGMMAGAGCFALAATEPGTAVGFVLARALAGEAEILTLAVRPDARRRGVGRALLEAASAVAQGVSAETLWLEVAVDNLPAIALYRGAGFEDAGRRPRYYARQGGVPMDALVLRRVLNTAAH